MMRMLLLRIPERMARLVSTGSISGANTPARSRGKNLMNSAATCAVAKATGVVNRPCWDLIQRRKRGIAADQQILIAFLSMLYSLDQHRRGKPGILQNALANQFGNHAW